MSEEMLESSPRSAEKTIEAAGFDEDLKKRLLERIAAADFNSANAAALSMINMPSAAGKGTRDQASARAWDGNESLEDAALRMLDDARKRIRTPPKIPIPVRQPKRIDTGRPGRDAPGPGARLANARDRTSRYAFLKDESLSPQEREKMRQQLKERFTPAGRASAPATLQGPASLADQRIDDAIARGQFKNLPRGKPIERDYNMSSPFLDTTEYFMNKIIQRQQIVPPWIEKQQELVAEAARFRGRLRHDWLRHVARTIASRGGSLESQIRRAEEYAVAEEMVNPRRQKEESVTSIDDQGQLRQVTVTGEPPPVPTEAAAVAADETTPAVTITTQPLEASPAPPPSPTPQHAHTPPPTTAPGHAVFGYTPFRDDAYLAIEASYHKLAVESLNSLTRSYNLMAPNMAKKPYFGLDRELLSMYADVAPRVAGEIRARALRPRARQVEMDGGARTPALLDALAGPSARVYDEQKPQYGLREFWRDLFAK